VKRVVIVQEVLAQYRVAFYEQLRDRLRESGVDLVLAHGAAHGERALRSDEAAIDWALRVPTRRLPLRRSPVWLTAWGCIRNSDLVIVEHANRQLLNYPLLASSLLGRRRVAFWGHGANLQAANQNSLPERFKRWSARCPDWWFAYTAGSAERVVDAGFPRDRITVVQNSIDCSDFEDNTAQRLSGRVIYVGGLDQTKRLDFLLAVGEDLSETVRDFEMIVMGDGPQRVAMATAASRLPWLQYVGPTFGAEKARWLQSSTLLLMPGLVGLVALDSFAAQTPLVTVASPTHSPEFEYLADGINSVVLSPDVTARAFALAVEELLTDAETIADLQRHCADAAKQYSLDKMVANFSDGVLAALSDEV
jgi:glycosyltransferase involved in cell wall biosynthesis